MRVKTTKAFRDQLDNHVLDAVKTVYKSWLASRANAIACGYKPTPEPCVTPGYLIQCGHIFTSIVTEEIQYSHDSKRLMELLNHYRDEIWNTGTFGDLDNWQQNNQVDQALRRLTKAGKLTFAWGANWNGKESRCYNPVGVIDDNGCLNKDWTPDNQ